MSIHSRISGPVSFYYLKPKDSSSTLPLFLLFGDIHFSYDDMCTNCTCEDEKNCCHAIYDKDFLKKIEKLAKPNRPIDFYIEFFGETEKVSTGPLHNFMEPEFQNCYKHTLKNKSNCPAPGIRWHYSDIRMSYTKNNIENVFESLFRFTSCCIDLNKTKSYKGVPLAKWLTSNKTTLFQVIPGFDISKKDEMHKIIDLIAESKHLTIDEFAESIIDFLFESKYPSLIHKQFKKQVKNSMFAEKSSIVKMMRDSLLNIKLKKIDKFDSKMFVQLKNFDLTGNYLPIDFFLLEINAIFVDLYLILRTMKKIDHPPSLCIAYLGNDHIKNIARNLVSTGKYEKVAFAKGTEKTRRCVGFDNVLEDLRSSLKIPNTSSTRSKSSTSSTTRKTQKTSPKPKS